MECMFAEPANGQEPDAEALRLKSNDEFLVYITTVIQALLTRVCDTRGSRPVVGDKCMLLHLPSLTRTSLSIVTMF